MYLAIRKRLRRNVSALGLLGVCLGIVPLSARAADYTFSVEPSNRPDRTEEIYKPLITYLQKATGEHFSLVTSRNYHFYWRDIHTTGKTDFSFDEAHLAAYRIKNESYEPLVHTAEPTSYSLVTSDPALGAKGVQGLVGHSIISMSSPSLGYVLLLEFYPNPVSQPDIRSSASAWRDAIDSVFGGDADAAMIPTRLKDEYPNLITVKTTRQFPGQCISAAGSVPAELKQKVKDAMLKLDSDKDNEKLLLELGVTKFVPASVKDYDGNERLLKNSIGY